MQDKLILKYRQKCKEAKNNQDTPKEKDGKGLPVLDIKTQYKIQLFGIA